MSEPTREETLCRMGDDAAFLLATKRSIRIRFTGRSVLPDLRQPAEDSVGRDNSYHFYRALVDVVSTLQQRVSVRDEIMSKAGDNNQEEE